MWRSTGLAGLLALCGGAESLGQAADRQPIDFFEQHIRPLLIEHCYDCHSPDTAEGGLRLDVRQGWERGGERGPAIVPGDPASSLLLRMVTTADATLRMPPPEHGEPLSGAQVGLLTEWIRSGAFDPREGAAIETDIERAARDHWAFQQIRRPPVPDDEHPIDFLIDRQLAAQGLTPLPPAPPTTLIRRLTFGLLGLPPTAEQLATPPAQLPQLIDKLLESPLYGQRWGRHWLDVARYSDAKDGVLMYGDARIRPFAYTYRDYVIDAFNQDKPLDQFIREQLAADQLGLADDAPELAAMGLLTLGRMFDGNRHDVIDDQIDVIGRGFLGLTIACSRCHDHKFDPIPTADYYSLHGILASSSEPYRRPRIEPITPEGEPFEAAFEAKLAEIMAQQRTHYLETLETARRRSSDYLVQVATTEPDVTETTIFFLSLTPEQLRPQITRRWRQWIARRAHPGDRLFGPWHDFFNDQFRSGDQLAVDRWRSQGVDPRIIDALIAAEPQDPEALARVYGGLLVAAWEVAVAGDVDPQGVAEAAGDASESARELLSDRVTDPLARLIGSAESPIWFPEREVVSYLSRQPGDAFRGLLGQLDAIAVQHADAAGRAMVMQDGPRLVEPVIFQRGDPFQPGAPVPRRFLQLLSPPERPVFDHRSGRLELAEAIASPTNPLTARVWVNRLWQHHFGRPLVASSGDFGLQTPVPDQLELLDYLAATLIENGWRTKPLQRLIVTSAAYQRSSVLPTEGQFQQQLQSDPENRWLWRGNRRRLDLEQMRDSLLWLSGELDTRHGGRPQVITDAANVRRTVYAFVERQNIPAVVQNFDAASPDTATPQRVSTTVPQQALFAMNSGFLLARSRAVAERIAGALPADAPHEPLVDRLFEQLLGRPASDIERQEGVAFLGSAPLEQLAQVLLMSNEWMFID